MAQPPVFEHFINGEWCPPDNHQWIDSFDPATGEVWARIARGNPADVRHAVSSASNAFRDGPWRSFTARQRADALLSAADILERDWHQLVEFEIKDNGKRITEVRAQLSALHTWFRHFAREALTVQSRRLDNEVPGVDNRAYYEPYGVIAAITPWNSPLMIAAWKVAPALAAGNTVVIKPSEHASVSTLKFAEILRASDLPDGVINVLCGYGREAGEALTRDSRIGKISFTGSDHGGRGVADTAAYGVKPVTLELGGKSPQLVFSDADIDSAINGVLSGIFLSNGQSCVAGSRLLLQDTIYESFVQKLVDRASSLQPGDPMDPRTDISPLANRAQYNKVLTMIDQAKKQGAKCIYGGEAMRLPDRPGGYYIQPTLFAGVTPSMKLWREEVFGPVLAIAPFVNEQQAVALANDTEYGLAAGIWTQDTDRAKRLAAGIAAGTIYINHYRSVSAGSPVGGYKKSGYGRELGPGAMYDFLQVKSVWHGTLPVSDPFAA